MIIAVSELKIQSSFSEDFQKWATLCKHIKENNISFLEEYFLHIIFQEIKNEQDWTKKSSSNISPTLDDSVSSQHYNQTNVHMQSE